MLLLLLLACASAQKNSSLAYSGVILQGFDWDVLSNRGNLYNTINGQVGSIKSAGFTGVWLPPPSVSADVQGYLPTQWYTLQGDANLRTVVKSILSSGMLPIADTVINHRCATAQDSCTHDWTVFTQPDWGNWAVVNNDYKCDSGLYCTGGCNCGNADTGANACYAPDVDHTNSQVRTDVKSWLNWLKTNVSFNGNRFDMVTGYSASYVGEYLAATNPAFAVGEYWDSNTQNVVNWIQGTGGRSNAFDFPLRYALQSSIKNNDYNGMCCPPGVLGADKLHSAPFLDNHDTARDDRFGNTDQIKMGYAYILTHPGTPFVFWDDWTSSATKQVIIDLIAIRNSVGINSGSSMYIDVHTNGLYAVHIDSRLCMKLGTSDWSPDSSWTLRTFGNNYAVWTK